MSRFSGKLGFVMTRETEEGVWLEDVVEIPVKGTIRSLWVRNDNNASVNTDLRLTNEISVLMDTKIKTHLETLKYVVWKGSKWEVQSIGVNYPRLTINLGGLYAHV
jgi:hypothetical protein|nr:MAG TPA: hypothetical protein [Caudoviricetes sp.]